MPKFAKLIELDKESQVLLYIFYNHEENEFELKIQTMLEGVLVSASLGYDEKEEALEKMEEYSEDMAKEFIEGMEEMF